MMEISESIISVIIPTYNRAHLIGRAIQSVLIQTYSDFELIIVDDCSNDNTEEVVQAFNDQRIHYLKHSKNRGVSAARNTGIRAAQGNYIAFQDSDDEWLPDKLECQMAVFQQDKTNRLGLVLCDWMIIKPESKKTIKPEINRLAYEDLLYPTIRGYGTVLFLIRRDLTEPELYFDENIPAREEWEFLLRISRLCSIGYAAKTLAIQYKHDGPHLSNDRNNLEAHLILHQKYITELQARPKALSFSNLQIARGYYKLGQMGLVQRYMKAAITAYPWNPDLYLQFVASFTGRRGFQLFLAFRRLAVSLLRQIIKMVAHLR